MIRGVLGRRTSGGVGCPHGRGARGEPEQVLGLAGGRLLVALINRLTLVTGLYPLLAVAGGLLVFSVTARLGGSGFLAIFLAGLVLGNSQLQAAQNILRVHDGLAWLSQITMFLMLGLLVTPSGLLEYWRGAAIISITLILVARPIAVFLSLLPFGFPWREHVFISWVRLRGAVPMLLAIFPLAAGLPVFQPPRLRGALRLGGVLRAAGLRRAGGVPCSGAGRRGTFDGTMTRALPSSTTFFPTRHVQLRRARLRSGMSAVTTIVTSTVSPIFTGARKFSVCEM